MADLDENARTLELLSAVREGATQKLQSVLTSGSTGAVEWNWLSRYGSPLHVAAYFGQPAVVRFLLQRGAAVNQRNKEGDTPLHKAALTGRGDIVAMLVREPGVDVVAENEEGLTALDIAKSRDVVIAIENAQTGIADDLGKQLLDAARSGNTVLVLDLFSRPNAKLANVNVKDPATGNSLLHYAAKYGSKEFIIRLQQLNCDPTVQNNAAQTPLQLAIDDTARQLIKSFKIPEAPGATGAGSTMSGPLERWINYTTGWKKRYFTVENGMLFFYNSVSEVSEGSRGSIRLHGATIMAKKSDSRVFLVRGKNSTTYHLRAENDDLRKKWLVVLLAASRVKPAKGDPASDSSVDLLGSVRGALYEPEERGEPQYGESVEASLDSIKWQKQSIEKLLASIASEMREDTGLQRYSQSLATTSSALLETVNSLLGTAEERVAFWKKKYEAEKRIRTNLEESLRNVAAERNALEQRAGEMFVDAQQHPQSPRRSPHHHQPHAGSAGHAGDEAEVFFDAEDTYGLEESSSFDESMAGGSDAQVAAQAKRLSINQALIPHRRALPAPMLDRSEISLWSVVKEFVGKDLSKIAVPVYFNEPLSFLQKFSEDMEYSNLLNKAASAPTSLERMVWVATFAFSPYSSTTRIAKPFNPILGETFEMDRPDLGFRAVAEQVSHHPPISACYVEGANYVYWAEADIKNRFLGNTLEVIPHGMFHVRFKSTGEHFSWNRVRTSANNLIIGSVWVDNYGEMNITNHKTGETCTLTFKPKGWWGKGYGEAEGTVFDEEKKPVFKVFGNWNEKFQYVAADAGEGKEARPVTLWKRNSAVADTERYYNFTAFAFELNELMPELAGWLPRTDSRLRPDQRALEEGNISRASSEKLRLEQKQRAARKRLEEAGEHWSPQWFEKAVDEDSASEYWRYKGGYWEERDSKSFQNIADIF